MSNRGYSDRVTLTGRTRPYHAIVGKRSSSPRMNLVSLEYTCTDCGHVGWSAHKELARANRLLDD